MVFAWTGAFCWLQWHRLMAKGTYVDEAGNPVQPF